MDTFWMFYDVPKLKKCRKCKSKKIKHHIMHDKHKEKGLILDRRVPASTCRKCGQIHVGIHAMVMDQTLEAWLSENNPGTMQ